MEPVVELRLDPPGFFAFMFVEGSSTSSGRMVRHRDPAAGVIVITAIVAGTILTAAPLAGRGLAQEVDSCRLATSASGARLLVEFAFFTWLVAVMRMRVLTSGEEGVNLARDGVKS